MYLSQSTWRWECFFFKYTIADKCRLLNLVFTLLTAFMHRIVISKNLSVIYVQWGSKRLLVWALYIFCTCLKKLHIEEHVVLYLLLDSEAQNEMVLNCHARNSNNWTSSLTSTTISSLSSLDSKLKVSS